MPSIYCHTREGGYPLPVNQNIIVGACPQANLISSPVGGCLQATNLNLWEAQQYA